MRLLHTLFGAQVAVVHQFKKPPYGGGNQFLLALTGQLRRMGFDVGARAIGPRTRQVLFNSFNFDMAWLRIQLRDRKARGVRTIHRVDGPISAYRGRDFHVDEEIFEINRELADVTVFQSEFSRAKHAEIGLDFTGETAVIMNAVDPGIFYPDPDARPLEAGRRKVSVVASSWSDNRRKGADVFEWLDRNLDFDRYEMTFVGNIQSAFENIRRLPAVPSAALAAELRRHDIYVTASLNDPCSNALTEALACGLPAVYRKSGGHPEIVRNAGLGFDSAEEVPALLDRVVEDHAAYRARIDIPSIAAVAARYAELLRI